MEIEELKQELFKEQEKFHIFLSLNTSCFFEYDQKQRSIFFLPNENFSKLSGLTTKLEKENFIKKTGIFYADYEQFLGQVLSQKEEEKEIRFLSRDGDYVWCCVKTAFINQPDGTKQVIGCINNNEDNHDKRNWLREQNQLDALTKCYNKQYMKEYTELFLLSQNQTGCLYVIDIDNFKRINNNMGRLFSDTVLANIAEGIRQTMPEDSIIGRIVADQFAVFIKGLEDKDTIYLNAERIKYMLSQIYTGENGEDRISCCIGISRFPSDGTTWKDLFKMADASLFHAKASGNGNVELYDAEKIKIVPNQNDEIAVTEIREQKEIKHRNKFSEQIGNYAQDLMSTTKDIYSAIHLLLEKISKEYNASRVEIYEKAREKRAFTVTYGFDFINRKHKNIEKEFDYDFFVNTNPSFDENGIRMVNDNKESILQCAFYEDGLIKGVISIYDTLRKDRTWSQEEKDGLIGVTRVLSLYLLRLKMAEKIQERIEHMKNYDALTGMPTLYKFKKDAVQVLKNKKKKYAVIYSDICNFKYINEVYGYQFGDYILYDFALELTKQFPKEAIFGRISADNYVTLVPFEEIDEIEQRVMSLSESFHSLQKKKHVATNIVILSGIYILKSEELDINTAIDNANVARKNAKSNSISCYKFYNKEMEEKIRREQELTNEMEDALVSGEFVVFFQPKIALKEETLAGAEALVRWKKRDGTIIPPDDFIPLFEKNGFILKLDFYVYEEVCKKIKEWMETGSFVTPISVNVSRIHLYDELFVQKMKALVDKYSIPPKYIELELTESVFVRDTKNTIQVMKELKDYGFMVSIDDFGAGYSSLTLLKEMETDVIKLDKEFFCHEELKQQEQIIVSSIINMAKQLKMQVISEGIETKQQTQFLKGISCDMVQGYYYAKPMPIEEFEEFKRDSQNILAKD